MSFSLSINRMWKIGIALCLLVALLIPQIWPDYKECWNQGWNRVNPYLVDGMMSLIDVNARFMAPLINLFTLKSASPSLENEKLSGPFKLPQCMKQPLAVEKLKKHNHFSILGVVFDVSSNEQIYGPAGIYAYLTGISICSIK